MCAAKFGPYADLWFWSFALVAVLRMPMRSYALVCLVSLTFVLCAWPALTRAKSVEPDDPFNFYISPGGDDAWSGRLSEPNAARTDGPFASLERAKAEVRTA